MPVAIIQSHNEVGEVVVLDAVHSVRDCEPQLLVLHIAQHLNLLLQLLRQFPLPSTIENDMGDVTLV